MSNREILRPVSYRLDVVALLAKAGCNMGACHGNLNGKGGSGSAFAATTPQATRFALTHDARAANRPVRPSEKLDRSKTDGPRPSRRGQRFASGSQEEHVMLDWIARGAAMTCRPLLA